MTGVGDSLPKLIYVAETSPDPAVSIICESTVDRWLSVIGGLDYWNGLLEWTTGMDFDLFFFFFSPRDNYNIH